MFRSVTLGACLLLAACAPAATTTKNTTKNEFNTVDNPLKPGDIYLIKGTDQTGGKFEGKLKITTKSTQYDEAHGYSYVDADKGFLVVDHGRITQTWLYLDGENEVVCVPYQGTKDEIPYQGRALRGTQAEIIALFDRFSGSDNNVYGASYCTVAKG